MGDGSLKKGTTVSMYMRKVCIVLLVFIFTAGIPMTGLSLPWLGTKAYAATVRIGTPAIRTESSTMISNVDEKQVDQAEKLGFSVARQERKDEYGNTVDTNTNPLGTNTAYLDRVSQLSVIGKSMEKTKNGVYSFPLSDDGLDKSKQICNIDDTGKIRKMSDMLKKAQYDDIVAAPKAAVAADVNGIADPQNQDDKRGNGTQVVVTAAIPFQGEDDHQHVSLKLMVNDYNGGNPVNNIITAADNIPAPPRITYDDYETTDKDYQIHAAAGDFDHDGEDEVAVAVGLKLYVCKLKKVVNGSSFSYAVDKLEASDLPETKYSTTKDRKFRSEVDVEAGDANGDGYKDLLVTVGSTAIIGNDSLMRTSPAKLIIDTYMKDLKLDGDTEIDIKPRNSTEFSFASASVDVGDPLGEGKKTIILGGRLGNNKLAITYLEYDGKNKKFNNMSDSDYPVYTFDDTTMLKGVKNFLPCIKCVAFDGRGTLPYVVFGNVVTQYNSSTDKFDIKSVSEPSADKYQNSEREYQDKHHKGHYGGDITDINKNPDDYVEKPDEPNKHDGGDSTYVLNTVAGNFDGNPEGREQIVMLHYNIFYDDYYVFVTWCGKKSNDAPIYNHLSEIWSSGKRNKSTCYPVIAAPDVLNNGETMVAEPEKNTFTYSDPSVIAVVSAPPYYKEFQDKYSSVLGNSCTTFGTGHERGSSSSNGVSASVGVSFGYLQDISVFGFKLGEIDFETEITNSFTAGFSSSKSINTSTTYSNAIGNSPDDSVVIMAVPYDVYYYKRFDANKKVEEVAVRVPYMPVTITKTLTAYNELTKDMPSAPKITGDVLKSHVVGDPRTYMVSDEDVKKLSNVKGKKPLFMNSTYDKSFTTTGDDGDLYTTQQIESTKEKEQSFDYSLDVNVSVSTELLGYKAGTSAGTGYSHGKSSSEADSVTVSGTVANVPKGYSQYAFSWCIATYNYDLTSNDGKNTSECTVVNYITKPERGSFPPGQPQNLHRADNMQNYDTADVAWNNVKYASKYNIYESDSGDDSTYSNVGNIQGILSNPLYTVKGLSKATGDKVYFKVSAVDSKGNEGISSDVIEIDPVKVSGISIDSKPVLAYTEGDRMDLSSLVVKVDYSNNMSQNIAYKDNKNFADNYLKVNIGDGSVKDGMVLDTADTGMPVKVAYENGARKFSADAGNINVAVKGSGDMTISVKFKVGNTGNAVRLQPNQTLYADVTVRNNIDMPQDAFVILALYDDKGSMVKMASSGQNVSGKGSRLFSENLQLPTDINNYRAKVFVWDGTSIPTTKQVPKANVVEIE